MTFESKHKLLTTTTGETATKNATVARRQALPRSGWAARAAAAAEASRQAATACATAAWVEGRMQNAAAEEKAAKAANARKALKQQVAQVAFDKALNAGFVNATMAEVPFSVIVTRAIERLNDAGSWAQYEGGNINKFLTSLQGQIEVRASSFGGAPYAVDLDVDAAKKMPYLWGAVTRQVFDLVIARKVMTGVDTADSVFPVLEQIHQQWELLRDGVAARKRISLDGEFAIAKVQIEVGDMAELEMEESEDHDADVDAHDAAAAWLQENGVSTPKEGANTLWVAASLEEAFLQQTRDKQGLAFACVRALSHLFEGVSLNGWGAVVKQRLAEKTQRAEAAFKEGRGSEAEVEAAKKRASTFSARYISNTPGARFWALNKALGELLAHQDRLVEDRDYAARRFAAIEARVGRMAKEHQGDESAHETLRGYANEQEQFVRFGDKAVLIPPTRMGFGEEAAVLLGDMDAEIESLQDTLSTLLWVHDESRVVWELMGHAAPVAQWGPDGRALFTIDQLDELASWRHEAKVRARTKAREVSSEVKAAAAKKAALAKGRTTRALNRAGCVDKGL